MRAVSVPLTCNFSVELRGFEPLTPSMRTRCATGLRYSPKNASQRSKLRDLSAPGRPWSLACGGADRQNCVGRPGPWQAWGCPAPTSGSVADGADLGVGVLVIELVTGLRS